MRFKQTALSSLLLSALLAFPVQASTLKQILQHAMSHAPEVLEAHANVEASQNRTEHAKSGHWPTVTLTADQRFSQYHKEPSDYTTKHLVPGVRGQVNIFAFGAIEKDIERARQEEQYYKDRVIATREDLAYTIGSLYLRALNMKEAIEVMKRSLKRHHGIMGNLTAIVESDTGRQSELVQGEARMLRVEQDINSYHKQLLSTLNTLSKYTKVQITENDLTNPFANLTDKELFSKYALQDKLQNPTYRAQLSDLQTKRLTVESESKKQLPKINLVGSATRDDRYVGMEVSWDLLNRGTEYTVREKASDMAASQQRLDQTSRDIEETSRLAQINIQESRHQLKTLRSQIKASAKVVDYYKMQFDIARRSLLDVLNSEQELSSVELAFATTNHDLRQSMLDYLYAQGSISKWGDVKEQQHEF